jgi:hypothetical protein
MNRRWLRYARWIGAVAIALIGATLVASTHAWVAFKGYRWLLSVGDGGILVERCNVYMGPNPLEPGWHWDFQSSGTQWLSWPSRSQWGGAYVPLWVPLLTVAAATAALWYLDRRSVRWSHEGRCVGCGYDLSGVSGKCPECGREAA